MENEINQQNIMTAENSSAVKTSNKSLKFISLIIILVCLIIVGSLGYFVILRNLNIDNQSSSKVIEPTSFPTITEPERKTNLMAFVRKGDVWLGSIDGGNLKQITTHSKFSYRVQHVMSNVPQLVDDTNNYVKFPRISFDGRYLSYISLTQESIDDIKSRELRIATESAEIKRQGTSEIFQYPVRNYSLHIYNISEQKEESLEYYKSTPQDLIGNFQSFNWAAKRNILYFIKDYSIHMINDYYRNTQKPLTHSIMVKDFCGINCNEQPDEGNLLSASTNGSKLASAYLTGKTCSTFLEFKLLNIDLNTKQISKQPSDLSWCNAIIGPWINNDFIAVEYLNGTIFYKYNASSWSNKEKLFEDKEYQFEGPIILSPNNRYLAYPIGQYTYGSSGKVDMRIRELQSQNYFDILGFLQSNKEISGNKILFAKWDSESKNIYFTLTNDERENLSLIKFNIESKISSVVAVDATDSDVN